MKTNKTILTLYIITLLCLIPVWNAATQSNGQKSQAQIKFVSATPSTCRGNQGVIFAEITSNPDRYYICGANDSLTEITNVASAAATPGGATTNIQYNNAGAFGGDADFVFNAASDFFNLTTNSGATAGIKGTAASDASRIQMGSGTLADSIAGIVFGFVGGSQSSGPGLFWSDGSNVSRLNLQLGLTWQGENSTHDKFKIRKGTGNSNDGDIIFEFSPSDAFFASFPYGTSSGNTTAHRFYELVANGSEYTAIKAEDSLASTGTLHVANGGGIRPSGLTFANLGTPLNGTVVYCSDCTKATPCAGSGNGALAKRLNGAWDCD